LEFREHPHDLLADPFCVHIKVAEYAGRDAFALAHQPQEHVLGAYVVVSQGQSLAQGQLQDLLRSGSEGDLALRFAITFSHDTADLATNLFQGHVQRTEHPGGHAVRLAQETQQQVLCADVVVPQGPGLLLCEDYDLPGPFGESFEHHISPMGGL
jgi:hypothetical protein